MKAKFKVKVRGVINVHDGYCSGNECSMEEIDEEKCFTADVEPEAFSVLNIDMFWRQCSALQDEYDPALNGSYFCENSPEAENAGLDKHDVHLRFSDLEFVALLD